MIHEFPILLVLGGVGLLLALVLRPRFRDAVGYALRGFTGWHLVLAALLAVFAAGLLFQDGEAVVVAGLAAAVALFALFWLREFILLMRQPDGAFPGRNDKVIWAMLLIVLPPIGMLTFWSFRRAHWAESPAKPARFEPANDLA